MLRFDREIDELIAQNAKLKELTVAARRRGFQTLADVAIKRVLEGLTSLDQWQKRLNYSPPKTG